MTPFTNASASPLSLRRTRLRAGTVARRRSRLIGGDRIAYLWLRKADFARSGADSMDSEGLIDHIRAIEPVVVACVFEEIEPELTRISLRSKDKNLNVSEICGQFGGGGHHAAAGARLMLRQRGCHVTGADVFPLAEGCTLDDFRLSDLNRSPFPLDFEDVDYAVMLDVIEHLASPERFVDDFVAAGNDPID